MKCKNPGSDRAGGGQSAGNREAALVQTLAAGSYTAIVCGKASATGVAVVEVYNVQ